MHIDFLLNNLKYINYLLKYALISFFCKNLIIVDAPFSENIPQIESFPLYLNKIIDNPIQYFFSSGVINITNNNKIYFTVSHISYTFSTKYNLIEFKYYITFYDHNWDYIMPSILNLLYNLHILCEINISDNNEKIYSMAHIHENICYICIEYARTTEHAKFGIRIYKSDENDEEIEYNDFFFFDDKQITNFNSGQSFQNDDKFDLIKLNKKYNKQISRFKREKRDNIKKRFYLKLSYLQPPICNLKRNVALSENRWYFGNIYGNYSCFCKGEFCVTLKMFGTNSFHFCKYYFYLTIIDNNSHLYKKTDYLLSDFFYLNIESCEAFPIFQEMIKKNLRAHYLTMDYNIYQQHCINSTKCLNNLEIIYGYKKINGNFLEKFLELILRMKVVIAVDEYDCIDNLFYNIDYITFIFLGHGVTYIKSYLYQDYISPKRYNKFLSPNSKIFIELALEAGWKKEDIIKIGYPKWDNYKINEQKKLQTITDIKEMKSILVMFTWRKPKRGKSLSHFYFDNIQELLTDKRLNTELITNNVTLFFCYHHALKEKKEINITSNYVILINQDSISKILKNCSLIITDFSSIIFDAIVQRKPLILYIPDALDANLRDIYVKNYYKTILKLVNGEIFLDKVFLNLDKVIDKIIYYIKTNFILEDEKLKLYKLFNLKNYGNTKKFINYIKRLK